MIEYGVETRKGVTRADCDTTSDSQVWKIVAYEDGWQIQSKDGAKVDGTVQAAFSNCINSSGFESGLDVNLQYAFAHHHTCLAAGHALHANHEFFIEQRSTDSKWMIWATQTGVGFRDKGANQVFALTKTNHMAYEITPVANLTTTTYTPLSATNDSSIIGVDVQLKIAGVTDGCLGLKMDNRGGPEFVRWAHRECNQLSDSQAWKIVAFNGGWQIQGKWALDDGDAYDDCIGKGADGAIEARWPEWHQRLNYCLDANHTHRIQQTFQIEQRSTDNKWVLWTHEASSNGARRGLLDRGVNEFTAITDTNLMAFEITPVSSLPAPTPEAAVTRTVTENGVSVTYTSLTSSSSLVGTDVQLKMVGVNDACLSIPSGFRLRRTSCDKTSDTQTWKIVSAPGGWQIQSKTTDKGAAYSRCIDGDNALDPNAVLEQEVIFVRDCLPDWRDDLLADQTFTIEQRSSDNNWMLWIYPGVGIKDWGNGPLGPSRTTYVAFQIRTIASIPDATPTPTPTPVPTSTPVAALTGHTLLSTSSSLVNTEVRLYPVGLPNGCVDIEQYSVPHPNVMWWDCDTTDNDQIWKIVSFNGGFQIQSKTGAGGSAFTRCIDTGTNAASVTDTKDAQYITFSKDCLTSSSTSKDNQTFSIQQRTSDSKYVIFAASGVALKSLGKVRPFGLGKNDYLSFDIVAVTSTYTAPTHVPATPPAGTTFTPLSATANSSIIGVDVQLKVVGVTETDTCVAYQSSTNKVYRTTCDTSSDGQAWRIQSYDGEWKISMKRRYQVPHGACMDSYGYDAIPGEYHLATVGMFKCATTTTDTRKEYQKFEIEQRSTDNSWVIFTSPGVGFEDHGSGQTFGMNEHPNYVAFQIATVSSVHTPTPTPVSTPESNLTSTLMNTDVEIKIAGTTGCLAVEDGTLSVGQKVVRATCDQGDDQKWIISQFGERLKFTSSTTKNLTTSLCMEAEMWETTGNVPVLMFDEVDLQECGSDLDQSFLVIQQTSGGDDWWIFSAHGIGLQDNGDGEAFDSSLTTWTVFEIAPPTTSTVSTPATPTATATATATPTATPEPTPVALTSDLIGVDVTIKVAGTNDCMDLKYGDARNGQNLWRYGCNGTDAQTFRIAEFNGGYKIVVKQGNSSYCLDSRGDHEKADLTGSRVDVWSCVASNHFARDNQTFYIEGAQGSTWHIYSADEVGIKDQGSAQNFTQHASTYTRFEITAVVGGV